MKLKFKHDDRFVVKEFTEEVYAGVQHKPQPVYKKFYELYIDNKLHSKHLSFESVCQVIYQCTNGKYGNITRSDYDEI